MKPLRPILLLNTFFSVLTVTDQFSKHFLAENMRQTPPILLNLVSRLGVVFHLKLKEDFIIASPDFRNRGSLRKVKTVGSYGEQKVKKFQSNYHFTSFVSLF